MNAPKFNAAMRIAVARKQRCIVLRTLERNRVRGCTCSEIAEHLQMNPKHVGVALGTLAKEGKTHTFSSRREGEAVIVAL